MLVSFCPKQSVCILPVFFSLPGYCCCFFLPFSPFSALVVFENVLPAFSRRIFRSEVGYFHSVAQIRLRGTNMYERGGVKPKFGQ